MNCSVAFKFKPQEFNWHTICRPGSLNRHELPTWTNQQSILLLQFIVQIKFFFFFLGHQQRLPKKSAIIVYGTTYESILLILIYYSELLFLLQTSSLLLWIENKNHNGWTRKRVAEQSEKTNMMTNSSEVKQCLYYLHINSVKFFRK